MIHVVMRLRAAPCALPGANIRRSGAAPKLLKECEVDLIDAARQQFGLNNTNS